MSLKRRYILPALLAVICISIVWFLQINRKHDRDTGPPMYSPQQPGNPDPHTSGTKDDAAISANAMNQNEIGDEEVEFEAEELRFYAAGAFSNVIGMSRHKLIPLDETETYILDQIVEAAPEVLSQIDDLVHDILAEYPDEADRIGYQLMIDADKSALRVTGALMLALGTGLNESELQTLINDKDASVPLRLLGALELNGAWYLADYMEQQLIAALPDNAMAALAQNSDLPVDARRQALLMAQSSGDISPDQLASFISDTQEDVSLRTIALINAADMAPESLDQWLGAASGENAGRFAAVAKDVSSWREELTNRSPDPEEMHTDEINRVLDAWHDDSLMSLALLLQPALRKSPQAMNPGSREYLQDCIAAYRDTPLSDEQHYWLRMIERFCAAEGESQD